jgi:hypothetical protein
MEEKARGFTKAGAEIYSKASRCSLPPMLQRSGTSVLVNKTTN